MIVIDPCKHLVSIVGYVFSFLLLFSPFFLFSFFFLFIVCCVIDLIVNLKRCPVDSTSAQSRRGKKKMMNVQFPWTRV
ncbi:hypothetical protein P175DRAFT_010674 [Aspergillus ochraceoroseus IBT 24754]|uniref:Uncharacterized protein n=1 Tax=Aspergillus ochraceoroseus IBT 24754 TaxID=1392256 RepID=A0A2T5M5W2_9EURO|nr:uncharacterized protein P175DRAFT_010674 [Aspergillus ochraceoroseus IBT 24754]PTU23925.1 hypothetical protein P175DRAFT_010674 [Aspergillus ochraceoroseus IBT 24754]